MEMKAPPRLVLPVDSWLMQYLWNEHWLGLFISARKRTLYTSKLGEGKPAPK